VPASRDFLAAPAREPRPARLVRTLSEAGGVSARALIGSNLVADAMSLRALAPTAANALGRAMMGAVLIAVGPSADAGDRASSEGESVQLQFRGDGPLGSVLAIADTRGRVRGTVAQPGTDLSVADGSPDVARAIGLGTLTVVRHRPGAREPYTGIVPLTSGEIAQDITLYLTESEQTPSAMGLGVAMANDETAVVAAGFLLQRLPDASEAEARSPARRPRIPGAQPLRTDLPLPLHPGARAGDAAYARARRTRRHGGPRPGPGSVLPFLRPGLRALVRRNRPPARPRLSHPPVRLASRPVAR